MNSLLQEITTLPGVFGCFVYSGERQIAASKMPPIFQNNNIKAIGNLLSRTVQVGNMAKLDFKEIEIKYKESLLIIKALADQALLILICEPSANKSMIAMTIKMLAGDIETAMAQSMKPTAAANNQPKQSKKSNTIKKLIPTLKRIKKALVITIGPIAGPVIKDSIEIWAKQNKPSLSSLPALTKLLCKEIDNEELEQKFMAEIKDILN